MAKQRLPYQMKMQERNAKAVMMNRALKALVSHKIECSKARKAEEPEPYLKLSEVEVQTLIDACGLAKDALKGIQIEMFNSKPIKRCQEVIQDTNE
ncbi:hypothetical protein WAF17_02325 [Bernardetia sp. ABR2-2B]|uniref:hypothetical protein n=1 Tax=Bernardetia sp. ABR2-2B TaxID=3127472 RepID=UPI0030D2780F